MLVCERHKEDKQRARVKRGEEKEVLEGRYALFELLLTVVNKQEKGKESEHPKPECRHQDNLQGFVCVCVCVLLKAAVRNFYLCVAIYV